MKGVPLVVGMAVAALLLPVLAVAAIAGAIVAPVTSNGSLCSTPAGGASGVWRAPLNGRYTISSRFGMRFHPVLHTTKLHTGTDLVATSDRTVVAAADGTVAVRGFNAAYGNQIVIDHGGGIQTRYAHMASPGSVAVGEQVASGTPLGTQGATGLVTGQHLHYEVIRNGTPIDPGPFMTARGAPIGGQPTAGVGAPGFARTDGQRVVLNAEQLANSSTIMHVGREVGATDDGLAIALMAALQESGLRNLPYGDRDSLGLFQQRAGWGSASQRQDPEYAARAFFGGPTGPNHGSPSGLLDLPRWQTLRPGDAAQAVQVSAFPDEYAKWEPVARALLADQDVGDVGLCSPAAPAGQLRVATWNLCLEFCVGKLAPWAERIPLIAAGIKSQHPDVISLQETGLEASQGKAIVRALAPEYRLAVYKRSKMILFNPAVLSIESKDGRLLDKSTFVVQGKGGVAQVFRDKRTEARVIVSSLHPVDGDDERRRLTYIARADREVTQLADEHAGAAVIHAGDLNSTVPGSPVATYLAATGFRSAEQSAATRSGQEYRSYNGGRPPRRGPRIDHIMVRHRDAVVITWRQILPERRDHPESDHHMIVVDLSFSPRAVPTQAES